LLSGGAIRGAAYGQRIYEAESAYNYIQVVRDGTENDLVLNEGQAVHSIYDPTTIYTHGYWDDVLLAPFFGTGRVPTRIALVGLAGGTVARQFTAIDGPVPIDGVELDPKIVEALVRPASQGTDLNPDEEDLLQMLAEGKPIKAIAVTRKTTPADVSDSLEKLFLKLAQGASAGGAGALRRLKLLHQAIVDREEQGESLSRLLPTGIAEKLRREGRRIGETETLTVTVLMSDIRGYSTIAEDADPTVLAHQLNEHRAEMNRAVLNEGGTVMQFVGDSVMAVFGAPLPQADHAERALSAARSMHEGQTKVNTRWAGQELPPFHLGIGLSTGQVAAALLGSEERIEYSCVGDSVNLCQRLQQFAKPGEIVLSEPTYQALGAPTGAEPLPPSLVKGRHTPVQPYRIPALVRI
jgi:class 3 adenylate cyclase